MYYENLALRLVKNVYSFSAVTAPLRIELGPRDGALILGSVTASHAFAIRSCLGWTATPCRADISVVGWHGCRFSPVVRISELFLFSVHANGRALWMK